MSGHLMESNWSNSSATAAETAAGSTSATFSSSIVLYSFLPALVQRRLSNKLRSLRRTLSHCDAPAQHQRPVSQSTIDTTTPPPSYHSDTDEPDAVDEPLDVFRSLPSSEPPSRPSSSGSTTPKQPLDSGSGVNWRYADQGFYILKFASQEASTFEPSSHLIRRQYVDGVACMLRGLPARLSAEEEMSIREALPVTLHDQGEADHGALGRRHPMHVQVAGHGSVARQRQSILHQWVATATLYVFLAASFILPYLQLLLREAYQFDRKHKITDRMLAQGVQVADAMGKRTLTLASTVCAMHDGKIGDSIREVGVYVVQGLSGGVYDGVGEGMQVLGLRADHRARGEKAATNIAQR